MTMGSVGTWKKQIGDSVVPGDVLVEIETDKAQMDFECQEEGYLAKILVEAGANDVPVGKPIAILVEEKEDIDKFADYAPEETSPSTKAEQPKVEVDNAKKETQSKDTSRASTDRIFASPLARNIASERGIDLAQIKGTGPNDRIIKADVENYIPSAASQSPVTSSQTASPTATYTDIPQSNIRKVIAQRLSESKQNVPHYYLTVEVNMDKILKLREALNRDSDGSYKLSVNDFVVKSAALALKNVPEVNSAWYNDYIRQLIATATPTGLITPIVTNADTKGLAIISNEIKEMARRAREGKLAPNEYQGGTFAVSNLGMYGIKSFTAIINPPQSCILAVGSTTQKVIPDASNESSYKVVNTMHVTLSCDHRVVDGAVGAQWLKTWRSYIENPLKLLL
ncbi:5884_t:CDS:2 [Paraglomus occultum]|uniref:Acetyltransferase component of pyruvate dehydrogenase complex n=1 Tax=Paraglomus occultum TaxID=144539 RepID=A0A9N9GFD9_9GLOM|nr:5884_t:CDS:2 [Paraglomus occultum]